MKYKINTLFSILPFLTYENKVDGCVGIVHSSQLKSTLKVLRDFSLTQYKILSSISLKLLVIFGHSFAVEIYPGLACALSQVFLLIFLILDFKNDQKLHITYHSIWILRNFNLQNE